LGGGSLAVGSGVYGRPCGNDKPTIAVGRSLREKAGAVQTRRGPYSTNRPGSKPLRDSTGVESASGGSHTLKSVIKLQLRAQVSTGGEGREGESRRDWRAQSASNVCAESKEGTINVWEHESRHSNANSLVDPP
jgi:hypothetical protein